MKKNIKGKILPPSSESFHYFENFVNHNIAQLQADNSDIRNELDSIKADLRESLNQLKKLDKEILIAQEEIRLFSSALFNEISNTLNNSNDKSLELFRQLPPANGNARLNQLVTTKLMNELDKILTANNIPYWVHYGALLGAYTRNGFIPWDDDIDICITRKDLKKLIDVLENNVDYHITIVYDRYVYVTQYRFRSRNKNIPSFIDLCVWDYAYSSDDKSNMLLKRAREQLVDELSKLDLNYWNSMNMLPRVDQNSQLTQDHSPLADEKELLRESSIIEQIFRKYLEASRQEHILSTSRKAKALAYSIDNMTESSRRYIFDKSIFFPLQRIKFEGIEISAPNRIVDALNTCYKDWPIIPIDKSILGSRHFSEAALNDASIYEAMTNFLLKQ